MKKYFLLAVIFLCSLFTVPTFAQDYEYEHISEFNSDVTVNQDATIDVVEEINYHFDTYRHGIYWEYPIKYNSLGFIRPTSFKLNDLYYFSVDNPEIKYREYEQSNQGGWIEIQIGDPDTTIIGDYIYVIDYTLQDVGISYFDDHDEVYFNVIGPGWQVPILHSTATIHMPTGSTDMVCYTGPEDSTNQDCIFSNTDEGLKAEITKQMDPYDAFTFALSFPVGSIENRSDEIRRDMILSNLGIFLPIPVAILFIYLLKKKLSNKKLTVIPHYEAPKGIDPLLAGYIYKRRNDYKYISAEIIWMATKGYISIEREGKKTYIKKEVEDLKNESSHIEVIFDSLFSKIDRPRIDNGTMGVSFSLAVQEIFGSVDSKVRTKNYINNGRTTLKNVLISIATFVLVFAFSMGIPLVTIYAFGGTVIGVILSCIVILIIASKIDIKSEEGNKVYYELEGLKMYIETAEKHRMEFNNDPDKYRGVFEELLPYAIIFGLEKKWVDVFKDLYVNYQPNWYRGDFNAFDIYMINRSINSMNRGFRTASMAAYGSASGRRSSGWSSGSSGFGGGGSSGGGGGGSGGGSW